MSRYTTLVEVTAGLAVRWTYVPTSNENLREMEQTGQGV